MSSISPRFAPATMLLDMPYSMGSSKSRWPLPAPGDHLLKCLSVPARYYRVSFGK